MTRVTVAANEVGVGVVGGGGCMGVVGVVGVVE
jgi:hypothetical protein